MCRELVLIGATQEHIASRLGVSTKTLAKALGPVMEEERQGRLGRVASTLYSMAVDDRNTAAAIFIAKTQMGWRETAKTAEETDKITKVLSELIEKLPD